MHFSLPLVGTLALALPVVLASPSSPDLAARDWSSWGGWGSWRKPWSTGRGHSGYGGRGSNRQCLLAPEAHEIVLAYQRLIAAYEPADAERYCADAFVDYSDSINVFIGQPLGSPTFASKAIFMAAQAANPAFPLTIEAVDALDCAVIALRWTATFGAAAQPVRGLSILKTTKEKGWWQIAELHVEFNSVVWLVDMGGNYTWNGPQ